jgi:c-di-GMP-binding flagellar brake protein YcgR
MSADKQNPTPGSGANPDSRRWERHSTTIPVDVTVFVSGDRANYRGEASDISRGGMLLFLPRELAPGTSLILEFLIPYQAIKFNLCGVIRNREGYHHGVEFINATANQEEMMERTCQVLKLLR